jgi:hypothetical protein
MIQGPRHSKAGRQTLLALGFAATQAANACPLCDTGTGQQVRDGIFNPVFWSTLCAVASPFAALLLILALLHFNWRIPGRSDVASPQTSPPQP